MSNEINGSEEEIKLLVSSSEELAGKVLHWIKETLFPGDFSGSYSVHGGNDYKFVNICFKLKYKYTFCAWAEIEYKHDIGYYDFNSKEGIRRKTAEIKGKEYFEKVKKYAFRHLLDSLALYPWGQEETLEDPYKEEIAELKEEIAELKKEIDKPKPKLRYILHKCPDQGWVYTYE